MLRSYRHFVFALAGLTLVGAGPPPQQPDHAENTASPTSVARQATPVQATVKPKPGPASEDKGCPDRQDNRSSDLCAQWKAADAAYDAAKWAWWQLLGTGIGIILGAVTMFAAIWAAIFAKRAAVATEDALKTDRAWVCPEGIQNSSMMNGSVEGRPIQNGLAFSVLWRNYGNVPAVRVSVGVWLEDEAGGPLVSSEEAVDDGPRNGVCGPNNLQSTAPVFLTDEQTAAFRSRQARFRVCSKSIYGDALGEEEYISSVVYLAIHQGGTMERDGKAVEAISYMLIESSVS